MWFCRENFRGVKELIYRSPEGLFFSFFKEGAVFSFGRSKDLDIWKLESIEAFE